MIDDAYELTDEQRTLRDKASDVAMRVVAPKAAALDREQRFPRETIAELAGLGLLGVTVPEAFGGLGHGVTECVLAIEELAAACASTASIVALHNLLVCEPVHRFGSETQRQRLLPKLATGALLGCFASSEESEDPCLDTIDTTACREGDLWVLRGAKRFVTGGPLADVALVFARGLGRSRDRLTAFLVPTGSPGVTFDPAYDKLGLRAAVACSMTLSEVWLPAGALLGREGGGREILHAALEAGRIGAAAVSIGIARAVLSAIRRPTFDKAGWWRPPAEHRGFRSQVVEMSAQIDAASLLVWKAAIHRDRGVAPSGQAALAKLVASATAGHLATLAASLYAANGCLTEVGVERHVRDAKVTEIFQGTSEILRLGIASILLKE
jgi:alkylation response protein AidB-like acyl-CoA dehydrogenase